MLAVNSGQEPAGASGNFNGVRYDEAGVRDRVVGSFGVA